MNAGSPNATVPPMIRFCGASFAARSETIRCGDWEVSAGEAWFVAGGFAAGKSAFLRVVAGLDRPKSGRIERFGDDWMNVVESESLDQRRRIGVALFHDAGLFHRSTVLENVRLPLAYHGGRQGEKIEERVGQLLAALELEPYAHMPALRLNAAVARRTLLARALALGPEVLLLDDPCAGLDERERRSMIQCIGLLHAGQLLNEGRPQTLIITGSSPQAWRSLPRLKWALLRDGELAVAKTWEQLVASAPELFHDPDLETAPD